jgi:tubulin-specific chaperone D
LNCHHFPEFFGNKNHLTDISSCLLNALKEYTLDNRGDIGAWVRETAMNALFVLITNCPHDLLDPTTVHEVMIGLAQQSVEKIDRTRGLAGKLFCNLVHQ